MDKIIANIEQGIKDGIEKARVDIVSKELSGLEDHVTQTIEYLTGWVTQGGIDLPVICMIRLMDAGDAVRKAIKEYEAHKKEAGNVG